MIEKQRTPEAPQAKFDFFQQGDVTVIVDTKTGNRTVAEDIENVLIKIKRYGQLSPWVIYKSAAGVFDGVAHEDGRFKEFYPIGAKDMGDAARVAVNR